MGIDTMNSRSSIVLFGYSPSDPSDFIFLIFEQLLTCILVFVFPNTKNIRFAKGYYFAEEIDFRRLQSRPSTWKNRGQLTSGSFNLPIMDKKQEKNSI